MAVAGVPASSAIMRYMSRCRASWPIISCTHQRHHDWAHRQLLARVSGPAAGTQTPCPLSCVHAAVTLCLFMCGVVLASCNAGKDFCRGMAEQQGWPGSYSAGTAMDTIASVAATACLHAGTCRRAHRQAEHTDKPAAAAWPRAACGTASRLAKRSTAPTHSTAWL